MNPGISGLTSSTATMPLPLLGSPAAVPTVDPAAGFTPALVAGILAWFDAADASTFTLTGTPQNFVSEWRDKSGNGYAVSQSVANNQPQRTGLVMGRPTIDFDGSNDCLFTDAAGLAAAYSGDKSFTAFVVGQMHTAAEQAITALGSWFSWGNTGNATPLLYVRSTSTNGLSSIVLRNDASSQASNVTFNGPAGDGTNASTVTDSFIVSVVSQSGGTNGGRVHTRLVAEGDGIGRGNYGTPLTVGAARSGNTTLNRFTIGALGRSTFSDFFPARLSEIILYSRVLADSERARVVRYLGEKYTAQIHIV